MKSSSSFRLRLIFLGLTTSMFFSSALLHASTSSQPQFVYVNDDNGDIAMVEGFQISGDGVLTPVAGSPFSTGFSGSGGGTGYYPTRDLVLQGTSRFLYVAAEGSGELVFFRIDPSTGTLTR